MSVQCFPSITIKTYSIVEHVRSVGTVIVQSFIHYIPAVALAFIVSNLTLNMGLQGGNQRSICPGARSNYMNLSVLCNPRKFTAAYPS